MGVKFRNFSLTGGGAAAGFTQWEDDFPDANIAAFNLRGDYSYYGTTSQPLSVAANRFTFGAGPGGSPAQVMVPTQLSGAANRSQFSSVVYAQDSGTDAAPKRPTIYVFVSGVQSTFNNFLQCYAVVIRRNPALANAALVRSSGWTSGTVTTTTLATIALPAIGATVRLEGRIIGGLTQLTVLYNGVQITQQSEAGGLTRGLPGFGCRGADSPTTSFGFESFRAGRL